MSVHRAGGSGLKDEALHPPIRGASCTGRARARRLDGLSFFGPVQRPGPRNSASAETTCGQSTPTKVQPYPIAYSCGRRPHGGGWHAQSLRWAWLWCVRRLKAELNRLKKEVRDEDQFADKIPKDDV